MKFDETLYRNAVGFMVCLRGKGW